MSDQETVLLKSNNAINLYEMDIDELKIQRKEIEKIDKKFQKDRAQMKKSKVKDINKTESVTEDKLDKRSRELIKILEMKEANSQADFEKKEKILRSNFSETIKKLITNVRLQRDMILHAYGPLVLFSKK